MEKKKSKNNSQVIWIIKTVILVFFVSMGFSIVSTSILEGAELFLALPVLLVIIFIGVTFDMIGVAVAVADERPLHSMAANKVTSAKYSLLLVKNASQVATFCNDVIGDIAGIISGTAAVTIVGIIMKMNLPLATEYVLSVVLSAIVASLTIGGKAVGKEYALKNSKNIMIWVGKIICNIDKGLGNRIIKS